MSNVINLPTYEQALSALEALGLIDTKVETVNSNVDTVKEDVNTVKTNVATVNSNVNTINSRTATMNTTLNTVNTNTARGAVKSVQRGTATMTGRDSLNVAISSVNIAKSILIFSYTLSHETVLYIPKGKITSGTNINFERPVAINTTTIEWQVIEFY